MTALSLVHPEFTSGFFGRVRVAHVFLFFVFSYYVSLSSEFRVVMSITISARCLNRFYLQLFVGRLVFYLRYLCLFTYSGVQHISVSSGVCRRIHVLFTLYVFVYVLWCPTHICISRCL